MIDVPKVHSSPPSALDRAPGEINEMISSRLFQIQSFWGGWGGIAITFATGVLVVGLLVGWVMLWVNRPGGPSITLLTIGCIAFTLLLAMLATLQNRLTMYWRVRQAQTAYLEGLSHNLRTPISAIRAAAQVLEQPGVNESKRQQLLEAIVHETRRLGLRVDNVLETGRWQVEGNKAVDDAPVNITEMMSRTVDHMRPLAESREGAIDTKLDDALWVEGDLRALRLMVDNLMDNALKYANGPPRILVLIEARNEYALIRIVDQGMGFSSKDSTKLFKRFWRGDDQRAGTGLGLSLAQTIARGHHGEVHIHSEGPGHGSVAEVWLPLARGG